MAWDSHLQGYTGITVRDPGEAPRTFRNNEDFLQWQHEQKYEDRTNNSESKAATPSVAHQSKEGLKGKGAAEPAEQANIEEEELHDLFMSAPDEITWPAGNNEVVEGGKVDGEDLRSKVVKASLDGGDNIDDDDDGLHDLFMSEPNEITWYSQANEAVEETPPTALSPSHTVIMASLPKAPGNKGKEPAYHLTLPATPPPKQPAFPLTSPESPLPREQPAPPANNQMSTVPLGNSLLQSMANMANPAENPTYSRMAHEIRENMKHPKTTVVFSPSAALAGPSTSSFAANTPTRGPSNKRNAQSDFEDRSGKKVSLQSNTGNAQLPQSSSQNSGPQNIAGGIASVELNQAVDARVVSLIRKSVNATIKKTLDEVKEHKTIYGMPIWPDAFPLKLDGQEKVRRTHEAAVKDVLESLLCPGDNGQPPMTDLGRILRSLIPTGAPMINDNLAQSNSAARAMEITAPRRVASLGNDGGQTAGLGSSKGKGVCVPNVVQVDGGVGLIINGGKGFVPLPGLPKSHQKKPSKGKAVAPAAVHQNDSVALQGALRSGDVAKAKEIASRIFPETPALGSSPEAPSKRKRTPAQPKATGPKATGSKKKEDVNQSLASAVDNAIDGASQNQNQAQATRGRFFPFPSGDPVTAGPSKEIDNDITDETLNSVDLDELTRQTFGTSEATRSSSKAAQGIFDGIEFNLTLESNLSRPVNNMAESEEKGKSVVSAGEGAQIAQKSHESPGPVDPFDASFNFDQHRSFFNLPATSPTTEVPVSRSGRFHPFPTGSNSSGAAIGNPAVDLGVTAITDSTNNAAEWAIPSQGQASMSAAGAASSLTLDTGKAGTQASSEIGPQGSGSQTIAHTNNAEENAELATVVANTLKDLQKSGLGEYSAEELMAARHDKKTLEAVAQFVKDELFEFEWWQVLKDFCDGNKFPYPFDVSFRINATAPTVSDDPTRIWKTQDERFCSDFTEEEIMWGAAVYGWNATPARYRFAKDHETGTIGAITPYYFIANGVTVTVCRDPDIFPILGNPEPTVCEWDSIKLAAERDGEFAGIVGDIYPHYREQLSWNVDFHTADLFYTPAHVRQ